MKTVTLNISKEYDCDVLVCGGGVSGFAAAVSSARNGAKTLLIESGGFLGGTATKGLVGPFMTCFDAQGKDKIIKGLFSELCDRLVADGGAIYSDNCRGGDSRSGYRTSGHIGVTPFDAESLKRVTEQMCLESGVKLLYHTTLIGCDTSDGKINCVYAADFENIIAINAKIYIDTTGTAALVHKAGGETMRGNDDGILQTASTFFVISGVNKAVLDEYMSTHTEMRERFFMDIIERGQADGSFPCGTQKLRIFENPDGNWTVNMAQVDEQLDELDADAVTAAEIDQRCQIVKIIEFLKKNICGLENIKLVTTASDIGVRESRRMVGKTIFCLDDIKDARKFDDRIAVCANSIDIHQKKGVSYSAHNNANYYIPLSCLVSKNVKNLLTAGKSLSADRFAFAAVRVMPPCIAMGQAAGTTAALAAKEELAASDVPYGKVQKILLENGAFLG
ncbi:MAG: FAD-dependent oxidoreductase [Ruminococcaceae bacterium]|nr:FAD-dependent oxidoreductase [Oscillospiraceae bacterium]